MSNLKEAYKALQENPHRMYKARRADRLEIRLCPEEHAVLAILAAQDRVKRTELVRRLIAEEAQRRAEA